MPELAAKESERGIQPVDEATAVARAEERETLQAIYGSEFKAGFPFPFELGCS